MAQNISLVRLTARESAGDRSPFGRAQPRVSLLKIAEISRKPQFPRTVPIASGGMATILFALVSLLVPFSKPSLTGARACRIATSGYHLAPATPSPISALSRQPAPVGFALPSAAADPRNFGTRQTGDCDQVASQRLSDLLAMAITRPRTRPKTSDEIRDLIRQMSRDNPLWGALRVHGELLKLGIEVSQATVGRYLPRRPKAPSPAWRSFCGTI